MEILKKVISAFHLENTGLKYIYILKLFNGKSRVDKENNLLLF